MDILGVYNYIKSYILKGYNYIKSYILKSFNYLKSNYSFITMMILLFGTIWLAYNLLFAVIFIVFFLIGSFVLFAYLDSAIDDIDFKK
ncbi:hypothetical protein vBCjeMWX1_0200 [Campylobacter phage vB_CjeM_WX1]|nr:hypothetical protein vBCjeMWX1_0200 [Campylobacter phage vB_CjeM_WX1]